MPVTCETARADGLHDGDLLRLLVEQRREGVGDQESAQENHQRAQQKQHAGHGIHIGGVGVVVRAADHGVVDQPVVILDGLGDPVGDLAQVGRVVACPPAR